MHVYIQSRKQNAVADHVGCMAYLRLLVLRLSTLSFSFVIQTPSITAATALRNKVSAADIQAELAKTGVDAPVTDVLVWEVSADVPPAQASSPLGGSSPDQDYTKVYLFYLHFVHAMGIIRILVESFQSTRHCSPSITCRVDSLGPYSQPASRQDKINRMPSCTRATREHHPCSGLKNSCIWLVALATC
jgi:hypothetical protein